MRGELIIQRLVVSWRQAGEPISLLGLPTSKAASSAPTCQLMQIWLKPEFGQAVEWEGGTLGKSCTVVFIGALGAWLFSLLQPSSNLQKRYNEYHSSPTLFKAQGKNPLYGVALEANHGPVTPQMQPPPRLGNWHQGPIGQLKFSAGLVAVQFGSCGGSRVALRVQRYLGGS
ncbi:hypothetical protein N656DRAFT_484439 [Canariomyces notabilis]|uniref:Uncharacterized protein n=1 Tax=Canariomyces notabilis TaxID=2074819 RepID=A0AAN6TIK2_9PEZI|nr:hypothetical protein N656DRAFT_484439 [Canariomyces arenarius]